MARGFGADAIVSVASSAAVVVVQSIFTLSLIRSFYITKAQTDNTFYKPIKYVSLSIFVYVDIAFIIWIIEECLYRLHPDEHVWVLWYWLFFAFIAFALMLFYILMLLRLYITFKETQFEITHTLIKIHTIPVIHVAILSPLAVLARMIGYKWIYYILLLLLMTIYGIGSLHLIYLFYAKLFKLTVSIKESKFASAVSSQASSASPPRTPQNNEHMHHGAHPQSISARASSFRKRVHHRTSSLSSKQLTLLQTIRKQTLLGFVILFMVVIDIIVVIVHIIISNSMFWHISWALTMNVSTLCIYLEFTMNASKYDCICSGCDFCCKILCDHIAEKRVSAPQRMVSESQSPSFASTKPQSMNAPDILDLDI